MNAGLVWNITNKLDIRKAMSYLNCDSKGLTNKILIVVVVVYNEFVGVYQFYVIQTRQLYNVDILNFLKKKLKQKKLRQKKILRQITSKFFDVFFWNKNIN